MTSTEIRTIAYEAVVEALGPYRDEGAIAEVLALVGELEFTGDLHDYAKRIAAAARAVWERKVQAASERSQRAHERLAREIAWFAATRHLQPSRYIH
jgi:hypothetical protein